MNDQLGTRMKTNYENISRYYLTRRTPVIMRLDGKAFHTLTRNCIKPFDIGFSYAMRQTAIKLCKEVQGTRFGYVQSDEISLMIADYDNLTTEPWFGYNIQKMTSIAASIASVEFTKHFGQEGIFDCRVFNIPKEEVDNYFIWRQRDCIRNNILNMAQCLFYQKQIHGKNIDELQEMIFTTGNNWAKMLNSYKNGVLIMNTIGELDGYDFNSVWVDVPCAYKFQYGEFTVIVN
jgi:tRNA(His) guanylyltransferase